MKNSIGYYITKDNEKFYILENSIWKYILSFRFSKAYNYYFTLNL